MELDDSRCPPGALPLRQAMRAWSPEKVLAAVRAASDDLSRNARQVYRIDEQGRRIFEIDAESDPNRPLLLRMRAPAGCPTAGPMARLCGNRHTHMARRGELAGDVRCRRAERGDGADGGGRGGRSGRLTAGGTNRTAPRRCPSAA